MKKLLILTTAWAMLQISAFGFSVYSENFESYTPGAGVGLNTAGWVFGVTNYVNPNPADGSIDSGNTANFSWYEGAAATSSWTFIEGGIKPGNSSQVVKYMADYGGNHDNNSALRTNYYKDITLTSDMINAGTINLSLDYAIDNLGADDGDANKASRAGAFLKALDVSNAYNEVAFSAIAYDRTVSDWVSASTSISLTGLEVGDILQVGLFTETQNWAGSAVYADNISVSAVPEPSTYALLAGFAAFLFVAIRRRK